MPGSVPRTQGAMASVCRHSLRAAREELSPHPPKEMALGRKGSRDAILRFMETIPVPSRRIVLAALQCVWAEGLEAAWPINQRRDFGKTLPPIGARETPPDDDVRPWAEAAWKEPDPFTRLLVLLLLQFGWRPVNQIGHLHWRNVRYDSRGRPRAIIAKGDVEGFK